MDSGVYFALFEDRIKVGQSCYVRRRIMELRPIYGDVQLLGFIPADSDAKRRKIERAVLEQMRPFKAEGDEWYRLSNACLEKCRRILADPPRWVEPVKKPRAMLHKCPQRHCAICRFEQRKADLADAKRRIAESAVRRKLFQVSA